MLKTLYETYQHWSKTGSVYILSDFHFNDFDCKLMDKNWIEPEEQVNRINKVVFKTDTLICLGDVGDVSYVKKLNGYKVLITGNHDKGPSYYKPYFDEVYNGPLFISNKILLSHEPALVPFALNIHGHNHAGPVNEHVNNCYGINLAANVANYTPVNLKDIIRSGVLNKIDSLHRLTIDEATKKSIKKKKRS